LNLSALHIQQAGLMVGLGEYKTQAAAAGFADRAVIEYDLAGKRVRRQPAVIL
jgi:hypothetical protein